MDSAKISADAQSKAADAQSKAVGKQLKAQINAVTSSKVLAAIDVGTSSIHMVVARFSSDGSSTILAKERLPVRLGKGGGDMNQLLPDAIDRAVAALLQCRLIANAHNAEIAAVATSAVREASNASEFIKRAQDEASVTVEVISGVEEARLIHLGALTSTPITGKPHLVVDIGGGSTEFILATGTDPVFSRSLKLGHIRLTDHFFPNGVVKPNSMKDCQRYVDSFLAPIEKSVKKTSFDVVVGCSGTISAVASLCAARRHQMLRTVANTRIRRHELDEVLAELASHPDPEDRLSIPGMNSYRRDVIVAGTLLLQRIFKKLGIQKLIVSVGALREGLLIDRFNQSQEDSSEYMEHLSDIRRSSVLSLAQSYTKDFEHVAHTTELALQLFDGTSSLHKLKKADRFTLEAAGLLHNIGHFVAHAGHHKHSYYMIRNSEQLAGFTQNELERIALVARYHRKKKPTSTHPEWAALHKHDQYRVKVLAGLLRTGIALDRTYRKAVSNVKVCIEGKTLKIYLQKNDWADADIELFAARDDSSLLSNALNRNIKFQIIEK